MKPYLRLAAVLGVFTVGCSSHSDVDSPTGTPGGEDLIAASSQDVTIVSPTTNASTGADTTNVTATVYIPAHLPGQRYPLILHSHGWGGSRVSQTDVDASDPAPGTSNTSFFTLIDQRVELLWQAGFAVVSFDERGFGRGDDGDDGTEDGAHSMSPDYEIQDARAVLDWAVDNLDLVLDAPGDPRVGAIGGSYGGGYQLLLAALDDRVDAITPGATWHNLSQSLAPNDVIKKGYSLGLCVLAQTDGAELSDEVNTSCQEGAFNQTTRFREDLSQATQELFDGHGLNAFVAQGLPPPAVDALLLQGNRDILFNLNQAIDNYDYLSQTGRDVRLISHENGHSLASLRAGPGSQGALGNNTCGGIDVFQVMLAWFQARLVGQSAALAALPDICVSLDDTAGAVLNTIPRGSATHVVSIPDGTQVSAANSNAVSVADEAVFVPLAEPISGIDQALVGMPIAHLTVDPLVPGTEGVVFVGIGIQRGGTLLLADDQIVPLRSSDPRTGAEPQPFRLVAVGELLQDGDEVGVLLYGSHDQFENEARSLYAANAVTVSGTVEIPISAPQLNLASP